MGEKKKNPDVEPTAVAEAAKEAQSPSLKKKKKKAAAGDGGEVATVAAESEAPSEIQQNSPLKKKNKKKRKLDDSSPTAETVDADPTQKKKKKRSSGIDSKSHAMLPEGDYVVGSLSSLFGGGSATPSSENKEVPVVVTKGETVIKPKSPKKSKEKKIDEAEKAEPSADKEVSDKNKDRTNQRENRKKAHEKRMDLEEKKRTLFVGNAPLSMNEKSCKKIFSQYGTIESVRMRSVMPTKETITKRIAHISHSFHEKQSSVNFYVKFKDEESVKKALAYNGTIVDRHRIRVDTCTSKADYDRKLTVFVGNLPLDVQDDELAEFFEENVGGVSFVRCVKDAATGMGKGFAFVVFKSTSSVPLALSMTGLQYQKRDLRITKVMRKAKVAKVQQARKKKGGAQNPALTKEQSEKINKFKFSTKKSKDDNRPVLKKKARKAIQKKKAGKQGKSLMQ
ncbi:hypothetical protein Q1695_007687 [Nippostrongylus brasiliensis]|nr:hypothetical protein Q1695_007687 [Nippostrongylus brasiliensis]